MSRKIVCLLLLSLGLSILVLQVFSYAAQKEKEYMYTNRLLKEKSPYLLQHAHNPVDWYPWGKEAFAKAKKENKPIFLSIGYSTCHWCHVMERESFSDPEMADIMNQYFVAIKVDREERPDIDNIYMNAVVEMTGSGGWPLTVFVTPDKKPFFGGTYFPPENRWGRPGLKSVLLSIAEGWANRRDEILRSSESLTRIIQQQTLLSSQETFSLNEEIFQKAYTQFSERFDAHFGGFGSAPKFPRGDSLSLLLRYWKRTDQPQALRMVEKTLSSMVKGGMYDHIGGGFHRYSTDGQWRLPHFEKMLYDQAILAKTYLEAYQATGKGKYAETAREIFEYILRDMAHPEGGFYSAEDADSAPEAQYPHQKKEGAFYVWENDEIIKILGKEQGALLSYYFGVKPNGNAFADPHGEFKGKNILYLAHNLKETAKHFKKSSAEIEENIQSAKEKLFNIRSQRPRPHLDDKILVDWNGLMISSLAFGAMVLDEPRYRAAAEKATQFILKRLLREDGRLLHRYRAGESAIAATIADYAFFIQGLFDLYQATFKPEYLQEAKRLTQQMLQLFWDESSGGFFFTADDAEKLLLRPKEIYDGSIPSGNSVAALDLIRLGRLTMEKEFTVKAEALFKAFSNQISQMPHAYPQMLIALDFALGPAKEIVIAGERESKDTKQMLHAIYQRFIPNKVVAFRPIAEKKAKEVIELIPFLKEQQLLEGKATAYVCINYVCKFPTTSISKMKELLEE
ncbi:MAG: thioredoxin domain-containing protein [Omnitrophica bacterium]|nr:thioredoxin domain-containing protein [Candidatus Omnitrophota bacterium]